jgi:hypothetical protein
MEKESSLLQYNPLNGLFSSPPIQYSDISSVVKAILSSDGCTLGQTSSRVSLGFSRPVPTRCVWCDGVADTLKESELIAEFKRYGHVQDILILRPKGQALIWFEQVKKSLSNDHQIWAFT